MFKKLRTKYNRLTRWMDYNPPSALSSRGWRLFEQEFKQKAPIRYWISHTSRRKYINPVKWKFQRAQRWILDRTVSRYHVLNTGTKPGYLDASDQMLHACFNRFKDFVEIDQASKWSDAPRTWKERVPFYQRLFPHRDPAAGLKHYEWASTLDDPSLPAHDQSIMQAQEARETLVLYDWWVNQRPNRKLPTTPLFSDQSLGDLSVLDEDFDHEAEDFKAYENVAKQGYELEEMWKKEDEEMFIRLVKIRNGLWS
jgi:hypothetical protein